ncbi:hypothetical protein [Clostridium sp. BL-8]|uniref:hypothetical protein n=1 Tax=Clostridium sp. BL-8 TaxID=349938 RepID=UPI00098BDB67|nr:hypothetical protein [Clostridium sp. BL-8]OOM81456.1 hypothetical protein CLOBL_01620 [Clostridium sp. BL-8]
MKFISYLRVELSRIFHSKIVCLTMVLTIICPLAGYKLYKPADASTLSGDLIANPVMAGAIGGGILFAMLTLLEFDRVKKYKTEELTNSIVSPLTSNIVRLLALGITAIVTVFITAVFYFTYTFNKLGNIFDAYTYCNSFFLLMLPSILLSIVLVSALYQIFCRMDISMILFFIVSVLGIWRLFESKNILELLGDNNILHWMEPSVIALSDYFGNEVVFRLMKQNRLFWFLVFGGFWIIGVLCVRRYGKGLFGSIIYNSRKVYIPILAIMLISGSCYAYLIQPFVYKEYREDASAEINEKLQLSNTDFEVSFDESKGSLSGKAAYSLENLSGSEQECRLTMMNGYTFQHVMANGKEIKFESLNDYRGSIKFKVPNEKEINLEIEYQGVPKINQELSDFAYETGISEKYIDLQSSYVFPIIRVKRNEDNCKITGHVTMSSALMPVVDCKKKDKDGNLIANPIGSTVELLSEKENNKTWLIKADGDGVDLKAANYVMKDLGNQDMPVQLYYSSTIEDKMQKMDAEKVMKDTIKYCSNHYGKLYNVSENNPLKILQGTVFYGGGVAYPNISIMDETCFSDKNLADKLKGTESAEILAHEISHQWFGVKCGGSGEGLAVYTTYRIAKDKYGEEYAQKNYVDQWKKHIKEKSDNFYIRHPEYLDVLPKKYAEAVVDNRAVNQYSKMPLQILKASELVGGENKIDEILSKLYAKTETQRISWQDFLDACNLKEEDLNVD